MPTISVPKKSLEPPVQLPPGFITVRLDGFKPTLSKVDPSNPTKERSVNLNPQMKIINNTPELNNRQVFENLNVLGGWVIKDFVHCFGETLGGVEGTDIPGDFIYGQDSACPTGYTGPLLGRVGQLELIEVDALDRNKVSTGKKRTVVKRYICAVQGCKEQHVENLAKAA